MQPIRPFRTRTTLSKSDPTPNHELLDSSFKRIMDSCIAPSRRTLITRPCPVQNVLPMFNDSQKVLCFPVCDVSTRVRTEGEIEDTLPVKGELKPKFSPKKQIKRIINSPIKDRVLENPLPQFFNEIIKRSISCPRTSARRDIEELPPIISAPKKEFLQVTRRPSVKINKEKKILKEKKINAGKSDSLPLVKTPEKRSPKIECIDSNPDKVLSKEDFSIQSTQQSETSIDIKVDSIDLEIDVCISGYLKDFRKENLKEKELSIILSLGEDEIESQCDFGHNNILEELNKSQPEENKREIKKKAKRKLSKGKYKSEVKPAIPSDKPSSLLPKRRLVTRN